MFSAAIGASCSLYCGRKVKNDGVAILDFIRHFLFLKVRVRQADLETGDVPAPDGDASEANGAAVFLHDTLADPEAQARTVGGLGGKKRFEEMFCMRRVDPGSRVADRDANGGTLIPAAKGFGNMQPESSALGHSLD